LENLEQKQGIGKPGSNLASFLNCVLFKPNPENDLPNPENDFRCDEIVTFVPSSRKIVTFLEVLKKLF